MSPQQAQDEAACARLCVDFANHIDARRYDAWLDLFTDDGVLDRMGTKVSGRAGLAEFLQARPATIETRHLCTNVRVDVVSPDEANGFCYVLFFQGVAGALGEPATASGAPSVVEYHDCYRRTPQGWRIQERRIRMAMKS
ncbi:MAG TPA: nuclear transport factor 2 family protein [Ramlibacter sp.]|nr:nuclear transport factor 2 family protein [Ramlibacter sp.]